MSIVTYPLNGITYNAEDAETYLSTRVSGVYASENCFDLTITADRTVTIGPGLAWVRNTRFAGKSTLQPGGAGADHPDGRQLHTTHGPHRAPL